MRAIYNESVKRFRIGWPAAAAALAAVLFVLVPAQAEDGTNITIPVANSPVVRMQMRSGALTIRTWDRPQVQITSSHAVRARYVDPEMVARAMRGGDIPIFSTKIQTPSGSLTLQPEEFPVPSLSGAPHDGVVIFGGDNGANVTLTVPNSTAFLWAMVGHGQLHIHDYRNGTFVARVHTGVLTLRNVSGAGYVETARGPVVVENSAFDRIRARTAVGDIMFTNCNARQIEVSSVNGSIAYDNGTFAPGLARFETQNGDIALGIAGGGVQIGAHSSSGQVYSNFSRGGEVRGGNTDAQATVNGGGPIVTASSQHGGVYLYDGAFKSRPRLEQQWRPLGKMFRARTSARRPYRV